jgi:hypothetical protein
MGTPMKSKLTKYLGILTALMAVICGLEYLALGLWWPGHSLSMLWLIPALFLVFAYLAMRLAYLRASISIGLLMGVKSSKIMLSLILILLYVLLIRVESVIFLISYAIYFITYLIFETWLLYSENKHKSAPSNE